jgi:hypothetical protein
VDAGRAGRAQSQPGQASRVDAGRAGRAQSQPGQASRIDAGRAGRPQSQRDQASPGDARLPGASRRTGSRHGPAGAARPAKAGEGTGTSVLTKAAPGRPGTRPGLAGVSPADARGGTAAGSPAASRTPFILLLLGLLGGGLVCLLVINTTLAAASFQISDLQKGNVELAQQQQALQQQVASDESPATIEQRAYRMGMRPQSVLSFIDLKTGRRYTGPAAATAGTGSVPGYGP